MGFPAVAGALFGRKVSDGAVGVDGVMVELLNCGTIG